MKVNFFYKPYIGQNNIHDEPPMNFNEQSTEEQDSEYFNKEAQGNWKRLSGTILRKDDEEFRNFLKSIGKWKNEEVLDELIKKKSWASERKENGAKVRVKLDYGLKIGGWAWLGWNYFWNVKKMSITMINKSYYDLK